MPGDAWVVIIDSAPDADDSREMLELVLAGATLEVGLAVVFRDAGLGLFDPKLFRPWRQLIDHELADLFGVGNGLEASWPVGVAPLSETSLERLCSEAAGVLRL